MFLFLLSKRSHLVTKSRYVAQLCVYLCMLSVSQLLLFETIVVCTSAANVMDRSLNGGVMLSSYGKILVFVISYNMTPC